VTFRSRINGRDPRLSRTGDPVCHRGDVRGMFERISGAYDRMNHLLSLNRDRCWRRRVAELLDPGTATLLDLCAGTGDTGLACLAAGGARFVLAVDVVPAMLHRIAGKTGSDAVGPVAGDGLMIPLPDACIDAVVIGFGVRNLVDPGHAAREVFRVLRPGGQVLILDFFGFQQGAEDPGCGSPALVRRLLSVSLPLLGWLAAGDRAAYAYLSHSMRRFMPPAAFCALLRQAGIQEVFVERLTMGIAHIVGGRRPAA
jgi:demethylmenaquinone methyltransferase / 2-methoxy-6-polyprenyl-1,4-benzoquinol methylase